VIWIVLDTARADVLRSYGGERDTMPYVDRIASEGVLYEHALSAAPWTLPSHASMLTGLLPSTHGCHAERQWLLSKHTTIAELLRENGYATYCYSNNWYLASSRNLDQGFDKLDVFPIGRTPRRGLLFETVKAHLDKADLGAKETNRRAISWIDASLSRKAPFFLLLNYMEIHSPHGTTPERRRWIDPALPESAIQGISREGGWYALGRAKQTPETFATLQALYHGDATYLNRYIEQLLEHVRQAGALDNTLLIITSDHGEEFGEHKLFKHAFGIYNTLLHVPLIVRYPKRFEPGKRVSDLVTTLDIFPTILDVTGVAWEGADALYGRSLLQPPPADETRYAVSERYLPYPWGEVKLFATGSERLPKLFRRQKCIQDLRFKYIWNEDGDDELYDLASDPMEQKNLIEAMPDKARDLHGRLAERIGTPGRRRTIAAGSTSAPGD
jgi:arylsulfatase A-like enzyme